MTKQTTDFIACFNSLKSILKKYKKSLHGIVDKDENYSLNADFDEKRKADIYFGAVQIKKNYVSYHTMPVFVNPKLLDVISPELKKRMQGKSCFNFKVINKEHLKELSIPTKNGFEFYKENKML